MMTLKESLERSVRTERFDGGVRDLRKALDEAARIVRLLMKEAPDLSTEWDDLAEITGNLKRTRSLAETLRLSE